MLNFWHALNSELFLQYALLGGLLASISCGIVGTFVVVRKIEYLSGGIAHAVLGGMGIAYFFAMDPIIGALVTSIIAAMIIGWVSLKAKHYEATIISTLWSIGMAVGIVFITKTPGYNMDLMSYLFGSILMISPHNLLLLGVLDLMIIITVILFHKQLLATAFDEEFARIRGLRVNYYFLLLLCMVAFTIVGLMQIVGLILMLALLTIPAAIARQYLNSVRKIIIMAVILGVIFSVIGLGVSYETNLPTGATIILLAGLAFLLSTGGKQLFKLCRR